MSKGIEITRRDKADRGEVVRMRKNSFKRLKQLAKDTGRSMVEILEIALEQVTIADHKEFVVMAGTPSDIDPRMLESMLRMKLELPVHRTAAAMLTVAFQIAKTDRLARGEEVTDSALQDEMKRLYWEFIKATDPQTDAQAAAQAVQRA
jgi:hypothetical protein